MVFVRGRYGGNHFGPKHCTTETINKYIKKVVSDLSDHQPTEDVLPVTTSIEDGILKMNG